MYNPLGLGRKAMPLACKVQNLLIADFPELPCPAA